MHLTDPGESIYVAGHRGLVGSAVVRRLREAGHGHLVTATRQEVDLLDAAAVEAFFTRERPAFVVLAAARVGGIAANDRYPAEFIAENLAIELNVVRAAHRVGVRRLVFLGSSCIYPKFAPQPIREEHLLGGPLEPTNEWYAVAKIAGLKLCQAHRRQYADDFVSLMPTNLYGPADNFDLETSHVLPAMIRKFDEARRTGGPVRLWGTGTPRREFLYVDDLADAVLHVLRTPEAALYTAAPDGVLNVGTGDDLEIRELAALVARVVGYTGPVVWDASRPDGTPRKLLDVSRLRGLGWQARMPLDEGIRHAWAWYREHVAAPVPG